ncbi:hypothetical protein SAMN06264364_11236 [Quadrisphaera granulorum]|uniref:Uncharacterized protein n=1 Tax=Quadrisphaera granulorum TaxID=317664 RepID=A0A316A6B2_9ACTN|nr:hypothetical protein BXY45_11236 [Quadrisphaera granulorum]SZE96808.1 hypothetical protein SAMN06264364_11236 [Quadrisphaera granulorum]
MLAVWEAWAVWVEALLVRAAEAVEPIGAWTSLPSALGFAGTATPAGPLRTGEPDEGAQTGGQSCEAPPQPCQRSSSTQTSTRGLVRFG